MTVDLDFEECIKDSPTFHELVHRAEVETAELEIQLEKVIKQCNTMMDSGKVYNNSNKNFVKSVRDMATNSTDDTFVQGSLNKFADAMTEITNYRSILLDQAQRSVRTQLGNFLKDDVRGTRELKKTFDKVTEEYSSSLHKYAGLNMKMKASEIDDSSAGLTSNRNCFRSVSMDYVFQINMLHKKKRFQTVEKMLSFMHALQTYFHQGYDLMNDLDPYMKRLSAQLDEMSSKTESERKKMLLEQERYMTMTGDSGMYMKQDSGADSLIIEGHLFKRASNAFKTWNRRWFTIRDNKLIYQKKKDDVTVVIDDVRLCTTRVADDAERRFCFEIISPGKSFLLQAETEEARSAWINAIQSSIGAAFRGHNHDDSHQHSQHQSSSSGAAAGLSTVNKQLSPLIVASQQQQQISRSSSSSSVKSATKSSASGEVPKPGTDGGNGNVSFLEDGHDLHVVDQIYGVAGNRTCADCGRKEPRWASISIGVVLCIACSGVHRSLGVHISKVRSLTLDQWEPEVLKVMLRLGNEHVNEIYLANLPADQAIRPSCSDAERQVFIRRKYCEHEFAMSLPSLQHRDDEGGRKTTRWVVSDRQISRKLALRRRQTPTSPLKVQPPAAAESESKSTKNDKTDKVLQEANTDGEGSDSQRSDILVFGQCICSSESYICDYDEKEVCELSKLHPDLLLFKAAAAGNIPVMLLAKCNGANVNWPNDDDDGKTSLMKAAQSGSIAASEFLIINGAKINSQDWKQRTPLHYAAAHNQTGVACQLLKKRVELDVKDGDGNSALQLAIDAANADIVTLIRLKRMNDEMKDDNSYAVQTDAMVNDVFRDFSHRATSGKTYPPPEGAVTFNILGGSLASSSGGGGSPSPSRGSETASPRAPPGGAPPFVLEPAEEDDEDGAIGCESTV